MAPGWFFMVFMVFHGFSWLQVVFSLFFSKMSPPKLYPGPMIPSRSAAQRGIGPSWLKEINLVLRLNAYDRVSSWQPETWSKRSHMIGYKKQVWARVSHIKQRVLGLKVLTAHSSSGTTMRGRLAHKVLQWKEDNFSRHDNHFQTWWGFVAKW